MRGRQRRSSQERTKSREEGWDSTRDVRIKEYNALFDPNMRHFFETPSVQEHLLRTGQIDRNGRVIDFQKQKGKLHIIEQEFKQAERIEYWRQKEERDMRERVQKKRAMALERARREEMVLRLHEDKKIRQEIVRAGLAAHGAGPLRPSTGSRKGSSRARRRSRSQGDYSPSAATTPGTFRGTIPEHQEHLAERHEGDSDQQEWGKGQRGGGARGEGTLPRERSAKWSGEGEEGGCRPRRRSSQDTTFVTEGGARAAAIA